MADLAELEVRVVDRIDGSVDTKLQQIDRSFTKTGASVVTFNQALDLAQRGIRLTSTALDALYGPAIRFEAGFAGVRKTVAGTEEELAALSAQLRGLSQTLPVSSQQILSVAEAAGQLGIERDKVASFTETMIKLGVASNLSADQAATALAQIANITQLPQDQFDRLGSAIVLVGNRLVTTESQITEMALNIAGAGKQIGLTQDQIIGFAGAISSAGIDAEAGGSSISRVFFEIQKAVDSGSDKLAIFARVAGKAPQDFAAAFRGTPSQAVNDFVDGLARITEKGGSVIQVLDAIGLDDVRVARTLTGLAGAGDLLGRSLGIAAEGWRDNNAAQQEFEKFADTTEAQMVLLRQAVQGVVRDAGLAFTPQLIAITKETQQWIKANKDLIATDLASFMQATLAAGKELAPIIADIAEVTGDVARIISSIPAPVLEAGLLGLMLRGRGGAGIGAALAEARAARTAVASIETTAAARAAVAGGFRTGTIAEAQSLPFSTVRGAVFPLAGSPVRETFRIGSDSIFGSPQFNFTPQQVATFESSMASRVGDLFKGAFAKIGPSIGVAVAAGLTGVALGDIIIKALVAKVAFDLGQSTGNQINDWWRENVEQPFTDDVERLQLGLSSRLRKRSESEQAQLQAQLAELRASRAGRQADIDKALSASQDQTGIATDVGAVSLRALGAQSGEANISLLQEGQARAIAADAAARQSKRVQQQSDEDLAAAQARLEAAKKAREELADFGKSVRESTRTPLEELNDFRARLTEALGAGEISAEQFDRAMAKAAEEIFHGSAATEKLKQQTEAAKAAAAQLFAETRTPAEQMRLALDEATKAASGFTDEAQRAEVIARAHAQITEQFQAEAQALRDMVNPAERLAREIAHVNEVARQFPNILDPDTASRVIEKMRDDFKNLGDTGKEAMEDLRRATEGFGRDFSKTFADLATGGKADFKDLVRSITRDLLELSIHKGITEPLFVKPLDNLLAGKNPGGLFDSLFGGGSSKAPTFAGPGSSELQLATDPFADVATQAGDAFTSAADQAADANIRAANVAGQGWLSVANRVGGAFLSIFTGGKSGGSGILGTLVGAVISGVGSYFGGASLGQGSGALGLVNQGSGGFSTVGGQSSVGELPGVYHRGGIVTDWTRYHSGGVAGGIEWPRFHDGAGWERNASPESRARSEASERLIERFNSSTVTDRQRETAMRLLSDRLAPNEVPAILEEGELVVPRRDVPMVERLMRRSEERLKRFHEGGVVGGGGRANVSVDADRKPSGDQIGVTINLGVSMIDARGANAFVQTVLPQIEAGLDDGFRRGRWGKRNR